MRGTAATISVVGAGNGGQAIAGYLAMRGFRVRLYNRTPAVLEPLRRQKGIRLTGAVCGFGHVSPDDMSSSIRDVVKDAGVLIIATVANAHREIACQLIPVLEDGQIILLCPGRTGGAMEVRAIFEAHGLRKRVYVAESQTLPFACRIDRPGEVRIIGVKQNVPVATMPSGDLAGVHAELCTLFESFKPAGDVLETGLENIGAILHPAVTILNAPTIERSIPFLFYHDMTPRLVDLLCALDQERLEIGKAFGKRLRSLSEWITHAYPGTQGRDLLEKMKNNPAYDGIEAPRSLHTRYIFEDVPTGLVPLACLAKIAGVRTPLMDAFVNIANTLVNQDFWRTGRTPEALGIDGLNIQAISAFVRGTWGRAVRRRVI